MVFEGYETVLDIDGVGPVGEYAVFSVMPQARFRQPLGDGHWVPYVITGLGLGYQEYNDRKPRGANQSFDVQPYGIAASLGAGLEYFLTGTLSLHIDARYLFARGQTLRYEHGPTRAANLDSLLLSLGLRVHFAGTHLR